MKNASAIPRPSTVRRRLLQQMAAGVAGGLSGLLQQALAAQPSGVRQGLHRADGTVLVNGQPAGAGMILPPGATVDTSDASQAIYVVGSDAYLQRSRSQVVISSGGAAGVFRVITGAVVSVFGRGTGRTVRVPNATVGIRGTGCYVQIDSDGTYFCLCYGGAELTPDGGAAISYTTEHHDRPYWIRDGSAIPAAMQNHDDDELALLESLVWRRVPFTYTR
jgi:hypothetical protein